MFLIWLFRTVCFRFLSVIVFDWPFRAICFRFLSVIVFDLTFSYCLFQVSICYCFWFDLFVLFVSGFYLLLFLIWPFRTVCFRFLSVIVFDLTFSYCLFQVSICYCFWFDLFVLFVSGFYRYCFWFDLFVLFVSGFYLSLLLIWPFRTVCFRFLSVIVFDLTFSYCLFQVSICYCFWFDLFVLFVSGFYLLLFLIWPFGTVCFRFLSVIVFDLTFSYCLFQVSICYCFWFDLFVLFVSGFYLLLFLIWPFCTVCFRFLSVIVFDLTFSYCLFQDSIRYCFWFDLFVLFMSGFYLLLLLIWPFRTVCFRFLSVIVIDLTFSYCLFQVSICYCFWFDLFVLFVSGFYLLMFLIWPFRTVCFRFLSVIIIDLTFSYCLFQVSICYCFWFDLFVLFFSGFYLLLFWFDLSVLFVSGFYPLLFLIDIFILFVSGFYPLLFLIWSFRTICFRFLSVIVFDLTFLCCLFQDSICYCFWFDLFVLFVSGFYPLLFLIWPFRNVCFRFLSVIVFDLIFSYYLFQLSICHCYWFDLFVLFVSGFYLIVFDLTFSYCLFQVSICYCFWFDLFVLFVSGFYLLLFLIWPFRTVCFRFLSVIVFDLTFSYCLCQVSICYCYWFDLFVLFVSGFYPLLFLIWPFRTVCFRFLSVIVFDLTFSYCLCQVSICYCYWFDLFALFVSCFYLLLFLIDLFVMFVSGFYLLLFLIWPFRTVCFRFLSVIVFDLTFSYCLCQVSICYCYWFDIFVLFVSGFYLLLFLIWPFRTVCFRFLSVIVIDLTFSYCLFQVSICYCFWLIFS